MSDDDHNEAMKDSVTRFLLQDKERCPECSSSEIDVKTVGTNPENVAWAWCGNCGLKLETDHSVMARKKPPWLLR